MIQMNMFDQRGKPTELGMRYVKPKHYIVRRTQKQANFIYRTDDVHDAIGKWLKHPEAKIITVW